MTVVIHHVLITQPIIEDANDPRSFAWLKYSPLHAFWAGNEAVLFFFLLSGFVLALPFFQTAVPYTSFVVRRICRIYLPYWLVVAVAVAVRALVYRGPINGLSS